MRIESDYTTAVAVLTDYRWPPPTVRDSKYSGYSRVWRRSDVVVSDKVKPTSYTSYSTTYDRGSIDAIWYEWGYLAQTVIGPWLESVQDPPYCNVINGVPVFEPPPDIVNRSSISALNKVQAQKIELGINLATIRQTSSFLAGKLRALGSFVRYIKTGKVDKAVRGLLGRRPDRRLTTKDPAARWLEYNFAVKPLVSDATTAMERIEDKAIQPLTFDVRGGFKTTRTENRGEYTGEVEYKAHTKYRFYVSNPELFTASSLGIGWKDLLLIAWDLLPFSFVVDWFLQVNKWLKAFCADQGIDMLFGYTSVRMQTTEGQPATMSRTTTGYNTESTVTQRVKWNAFRRILHSSPLIGIPQLNRDPLNAWVLATSAALLRQFARR